MKTRPGLLATLLIVALLFVSCTPAAAPALKEEPTASRPAPMIARAGPEQAWENIVAEGKKEGTVSVYAIWASEHRTALTQGFKNRFGINLEFTPFARGVEIAARTQQERTGGLYVADVFGAGSSTLVATLKPAGLLGPIEPLLVLPEVTDPKLWTGGKFPFLDADKMAVGMIASKNAYVIYNTDMVKKGEIAVYKHVLKPQYKGKITLNDPSVTGPGSSFLANLALYIWNQEEALEFLKQLIKQQEVVIQRDPRLHVESVARGKFAIGLAAQPEVMIELVNAKAPIDVGIIKEGAFVSAGAGAIGVPARFAHPNAARVFLNWLLGKEGQTIFARTSGNASMRSDVPTEGIHPMFFPSPEEKVFLDTEEAVLYRAKVQGIVRDVVQEATK